MADFKSFKEAVENQFALMQRHKLFQAGIKLDKIWEVYLQAFPPGTNEMFRQRREYECNCCKQFIRQAGPILAIVDGKVVSIWDVDIPEPFNHVAKALSTYVKNCGIVSVFRHTEKQIGTDYNLESHGENPIKWSHFHIRVPAAYQTNKGAIGTVRGKLNGAQDILARSLSGISMEAIETIEELTAQGSLYKGDAFKHQVGEFKKHLKTYLALDEEARWLYTWANCDLPETVTHFKNSVIGTLAENLTAGKELEYCVKEYEKYTAPTNYRRPTALVTKGMIEKAQKEISELGLVSALERRYAKLGDITINNVLFANRDTAKTLTGDVFDQLKPTSTKKSQEFGHVEEVSIDTFVKDILPKASKLEVMFENKHAANLVSLIAPVDAEAKPMFKWPNRFSWSYVGDVTDSIKERVKAAGGNVTGDLRISLSWFNSDDLDLHVKEPNGNVIYFSSKRSGPPGYGALDVDMNAGYAQSRTPVENVTYPNRGTMLKGMYRVFVHNFAQRETVDFGFELEIEFDGIRHNFVHEAPLANRKQVHAADIKLSDKREFSVLSALRGSRASREVWGLKTEEFHEVHAMMLSPNYWDGHESGSKHYFFMLKGCENGEKARGFFNEFLTPELADHRRVLELIGAKMKTDEAKDQLSGIGFSATKRESLLCRVSGNFNRVVKINF